MKGPVLICKPCRNAVTPGSSMSLQRNWHTQCRGANWCDCQHVVTADIPPRLHTTAEPEAQPVSPEPPTTDYRGRVNGGGDKEVSIRVADNPNDSTHCPSCGSPDPRWHPVVSGGGEVTRICPDKFHTADFGG